MSMRRVASVALAVALLTAACTATAGTTTSSLPEGDSATLPPPPPSDEPGDTEPPTTETTEPATQVTEPGSPETTVPSSTTEPGASFHPSLPIAPTPPEPLPGSGGAAGSGCAPASDDLPDGMWFVSMVERRPDAVVGDLACFWFGDIAYEVGEAAGEEVANDYFISNDSDRTRTTPVTADTVVWTLAGDPTEGYSDVPFADWPGAPPTYVQCPGDLCTVWLFVNDGVVTDIVEQYLP